MFDRIPDYVPILISMLLLLVIIGMFWLLSSRLKNLATIQRLLYTDELTGLWSKRGFERNVGNILQNASADRQFAMVAFDINSFAVFNETNGASAGDALLLAIAQTLKKHCAVGETGARYSADCFAVLLEGRDFEEIKNRILVIDKDFRSIAQGKNILVSYGVRMVDDRNETVQKQYDRASVAKESVKGNFDQFIAEYNDEMYNRRLEDNDLVSRFDAAVKNNCFLVYYQPQYNTFNGKIVGAEALVRWQFPDGEIIPPARFIELFERKGLIVRLDFYVFEQVCRQIASMCEEKTEIFPISVNMSRAHMFEADLVEKLLTISDSYGVEPELLEIELTESAFMFEPAVVAEMIDSLRSAGFKVSIDDFGSGFSSLNLLKDLSLDALKIDMRFLEGFEKGGKVGTVVTSVVRMARWLNLPVVAEGVENEAQYRFLKSIGCDCIQGYFFAKPMPAAEFEDRIKDDVRLEPGDGLSDLYQNEINELMGGSLLVSKIIESLSGAFALYEYIDGNLEVIRMNDAYLDLLEDGGNDKGRYSKILDNLLAEDREKVVAAIENTTVTGKPVRGVGRRRTASGKIQFLQGAVCRVGGRSERPIICMSFYDITKCQGITKHHISAI